MDGRRWLPLMGLFLVFASLLGALAPLATALEGDVHAGEPGVNRNESSTYRTVNS